MRKIYFGIAIGSHYKIISHQDIAQTIAVSRRIDVKQAANLKIRNNNFDNILKFNFIKRW